MSTINYYEQRVSMTILSGAQTPAAAQVANCQGRCLIGIRLPSTFDGTAFTLEESDSKSGTFTPIKDSTGNSFGATGVAASQYVWLDGRATLGAQYIRVNCGSAQATTDTILTLVFRQLA